MHPCQGTASPLPPSPSHLPGHLSRCPQNRDTRNEKGPNHSRCPQIRDTGNAPDAQPLLPGTFWPLFVPGNPIFRSPGTFDPHFVPSNPLFSLPGSHRSCRQRALRPRAHCSRTEIARNRRTRCPAVVPNPARSHTILSGGGARSCPTDFVSTDGPFL